MRLVGRLTHLPKPVTMDRATELLAQFDLSDAGDRTVKTYSGGMRRRLDLAAALVHRPPILFLDEPTSGLDPRSRIDLWGVIEGLVAEGTTLLLTTQYLEEADRLADNIAVIDHGRVIAEGTSAELKAGFGATIVEITFTEPAHAAKARDSLTTFGTAEVLADGTTASVKLDGGAKAVIGVVRTLDDDGLEPDGLVVREPTLDDVFLSLTGQPAEDTAGDSTTNDSQDSHTTAATTRRGAA